MNDSKHTVHAALAGVMALSLGIGTATAAFAETITIAQPGEKPSYIAERCLGVVVAGKNDCKTATHECATHATIDRDPYSWIYLPIGACERIGGIVLPPS